MILGVPLSEIAWLALAIRMCAAWSLCSAKRLFHLRPQIDLVLSAAKSALGT